MKWMLINLTQHGTTTLTSMIIVLNHKSLLKMLRLFMELRRFGGRESPLSSLSCHVRSINLQTKILWWELKSSRLQLDWRAKKWKTCRTKIAHFFSLLLDTAAAVSCQRSTRKSQWLRHVCLFVCLSISLWADTQVSNTATDIKHQQQLLAPKQPDIQKTDVREKTPFKKQLWHLKKQYFIFKETKSFNVHNLLTLCNDSESFGPQIPTGFAQSLVSGSEVMHSRLSALLKDN